MHAFFAISRTIRGSGPARKAAASASLAAGLALSVSSFAAPSRQASVDSAYVYEAPPRAEKPATDIPVAVRVPLPKPMVLFVLGGPGAGKGTQCGRLVREFGFVHLSAGDLLREERDSGSPDGEMIERYIREGTIVPVEVTVKLIEKAMHRAAPHGGGKFLIDGFPRNHDNLKGWESVIGDKAEVAGVLAYECPDAVMEERLLERGKTSGRSDDTAEVIRKRFRTHAESTLPVVRHFAERGRVFRVNAHQPVEAVAADTRALIAPLVAAEVSRYQRALLDAVHAGDWETYAALSEPGLTAIEAESNGVLVRGLDFHQLHFDAAAVKRTIAAAAAVAAGKRAPALSTSVIAPGSAVTLLSGHTAVTAGTRLVQRPDRVDAFAETRVWRCEGGLWRQVHFHRSALPA